MFVFAGDNIIFTTQHRQLIFAISALSLSVANEMAQVQTLTPCMKRLTMLVIHNFHLLELNTRGGRDE